MVWTARDMDPPEVLRAKDASEQAGVASSQDTGEMGAQVALRENAQSVSIGDRAITS